jgi:hypothetical protein
MVSLSNEIVADLYFQAVAPGQANFNIIDPLIFKDFYGTLITPLTNSHTLEISDPIADVIDTAGPVISNLTISTTSNTALIKWETDEPATGKIYYGLDTSYGNEKISTDLLVSHEMFISGLQPETVYHFALEAADSMENITHGEDGIFQTAKEAPAIISFQLSAVSVNLNQEFKINLSVSQAINVHQTAFDLAYDPAVIEFISAQAGNLIPAECSPDALIYEIPPQSGTISAALTAQDFSCAGGSGDKMMIEYTFKSLNVSTTTEIKAFNGAMYFVYGYTQNPLPAVWPEPLKVEIKIPDQTSQGGGSAESLLDSVSAWGGGMLFEEKVATTGGEEKPVVLGLESCGDEEAANIYKNVYGHEPATAEECEDAIRIINGRWVRERIDEFEVKAKDNFKLIYKREADPNNTSDLTAIMILAYDLRPQPENKAKEIVAISHFFRIFGKLPFSNLDWRMIHAIAYSGAIR